jgi:hypothetical protein
MITIQHLELGVMTRDQQWAGSSGSVQLFIDSTQVSLTTPPGRGIYRRMMAYDLSIALNPAVEIPIEIGISNRDMWGIREAVLSGIYVPDGGPSFRCAMAIWRPTFNDESQVERWLSQDSGEGPSRIPMSRFLQAEPTSLIRELAVSIVTDRSYAVTQGPIELLVYSTVGNIPVVVYQTTLSRVGRQDPGSEDYFLRIPLPFDGIQSSDLSSMVLINRSDDAWGVVDAKVFGWGIGQTGEAIGGMLSHPRGIATAISQDVSDRFPQPAEGLGYPNVDWGTPKDHVIIELLDIPAALPSS